MTGFEPFIELAGQLDVLGAMIIVAWAIWKKALRLGREFDAKKEWHEKEMSLVEADRNQWKDRASSAEHEAQELHDAYILQTTKYTEMFRQINEDIDELRDYAKYTRDLIPGPVLTREQVERDG